MRIIRSSHVTAEDLAALAEGNGRETDRDAILAHLSVCRTCMSAYADAVRYRAAWLAAPDLFGTPSGLVRSGLDAVPTLEVAGPRGDDKAVPSNASRPRLAFATAFALVAVAAAAWLWTSVAPRRDDTAAVPDAIRRALCTTSSVGLVLPGGEAGAAAEPRRVRSEAPAIDSTLASAVDRARDAYEAGQRSPHAAYTLAAGLLATGQLEAAREYVFEARRRTPDDYRLTVLAADLGYRASDLAGAERELRHALSVRPRDRVASLNLGIVLAEQGHREAAIRSLEAPARGTDPVSMRARRELSALGVPPAR